MLVEKILQGLGPLLLARASCSRAAGALRCGRAMSWRAQRAGARSALAPGLRSRSAPAVARRSLCQHGPPKRGRARLARQRPCAVPLSAPKRVCLCAFRCWVRRVGARVVRGPVAADGSAARPSDGSVVCRLTLWAANADALDSAPPAWTALGLRRSRPPVCLFCCRQPWVARAALALGCCSALNWHAVLARNEGKGFMADVRPRLQQGPYCFHIRGRRRPDFRHRLWATVVADVSWPWIDTLHLASMSDSMMSDTQGHLSLSFRFHFLRPRIALICGVVARGRPFADSTVPDAESRECGLNYRLKL